MRLALDPLVTALGDRLPVALVARAFALAAGDACVALCMHRVGVPAPDDRADMTCRPETLDAVVDALLATRPRARAPWLTVTFDDGYLDAVEYVRSRAPRYPGVEWLLFVCPEKAERGAGFRWDVPGWPAERAKDAVDVEQENARPELLAAGRAPATRVATVEELRALRALPNVTLGNHTNTHALQTRLAPEQARAEYARSVAAFERLFGPHRQFAYPFGTPHHEVGEAHVRLLWTFGDFDVWTTERRPYAAAERAAGAPLPRFSPRGSWGAGAIVAWMAVHALRWRLARHRGRFGPALVRRGAAPASAAPPSRARGTVAERA